MNLRKKTALAMCVMLVLLMLVLYAVARYNIVNAFDDLQQQDIRKDLGRATNALSADIENLNAFCQTIASEELSSRLIDQVEQNNVYFSNRVFSDKKYNFVYIYNTKGDTVFKQARDIGSGQVIPFPQSLIEMHVSGKSPFNQHSELTGAAGVVMLTESPALFSLWPVRAAGTTGQTSGYLIIGRYLDSDYVQSLAAAANLYHLNVYNADLSANESDIQAVMPKFNSGDISPTQYLNGFIAVYTHIRDANNHPVIILKVDKPADIYAAGQTNIKILFLFSLVTGAIFIVTILLILDKMVLAKLFRLKTEVDQITLDGAVSQESHPPGKMNFRVWLIPSTG